MTKDDEAAERELRRLVRKFRKLMEQARIGPHEGSLQFLDVHGGCHGYTDTSDLRLFVDLVWVKMKQRRKRARIG